MNVLDIILGVILLFGLVRGFMKGFFVELAALIALIAGIYGAIHYSYFLEKFLHDLVSWDENYIELTAFALTFILIVVVISLLGKLLTKFSSMLALGLINRLLGAVFGFLKMAFLLSIIILFFDRFNEKGNFLEQNKIDTSVLYEPVKGFVPMVLPAVMNLARENNLIEENKIYLE